MPIRIFVTGGTFDKEYNEISGQLYFKETHLPEMIASSRVTPKSTVKTLMMIDSPDMKPEDRELVVKEWNAASEEAVPAKRCGKSYWKLRTCIPFSVCLPVSSMPMA